MILTKNRLLGKIAYYKGVFDIYYYFPAQEIILNEEDVDLYALKVTEWDVELTDLNLALGKYGDHLPSLNLYPETLHIEL